MTTSVRRLTNDDDPVVHTSCCDDHEVSLCSADISGCDLEFSRRVISQECVVCEDIGALTPERICRVCPINLESTNADS